MAKKMPAKAAKKVAPKAMKKVAPAKAAKKAPAKVAKKTAPAKQATVAAPRVREPKHAPRAATKRTPVQPPPPPAPPKPKVEPFNRALNKQVLGLAPLVSESATRPTLHSIHIEADKAVATDGHQLTMVTLPRQSRDAAPAITGMEHAATWPNFMLPPETATEMAKAIDNKAAKSLPACGFVYVGGATDGKQVQLGVTDLHRPKVTTVPAVDGRYPEYQRVVPNAAESDYQIAFDARLLKRVIDYACKFSDDNIVPVKFSFWRHRKANGEFTPHAAVLEADNRETGQRMTSVVMPCKADILQSPAMREGERQHLPDGPITASRAPLQTASQPPVVQRTASQQRTAQRTASPRAQRSGGNGNAGGPIFGHSTAGILRWLGRENATSQEATDALAAFGVTVSPTMIRDNIGAGRRTSPRYDESRIPQLTAEQSAELLRAAGRAVASVKSPAATAAYRRRK
jgi:hypothetical protein